MSRVRPQKIGPGASCGGYDVKVHHNDVFLPRLVLHVAVTEK